MPSSGACPRGWRSPRPLSHPGDHGNSYNMLVEKFLHRRPRSIRLVLVRDELNGDVGVKISLVPLLCDGDPVGPDPPVTDMILKKKPTVVRPSVPRQHRSSDEGIYDRPRQHTSSPSRRTICPPTSYLRASPGGTARVSYRARAIQRARVVLPRRMRHVVFHVIGPARRLVLVVHHGHVLRLRPRPRGGHSGRVEVLLVLATSWLGSGDEDNYGRTGRGGLSDYCYFRPKNRVRRIVRELRSYC